ncbi:MAG: hypothetical protein JWO22_1270 [Frankiales bacterium]|nr:hypothetical protein [Frankiales bacterium]
MTYLAADSVDGISAGWLGFLIVVLLGVATVLLIRNMNGRLKRLPKSFEGDDDASSSGPTAGA